MLCFSPSVLPCCPRPTTVGAGVEGARVWSSAYGWLSAPCFTRAMPPNGWGVAAAKAPTATGREGRHASDAATAGTHGSDAATAGTHTQASSAAGSRHTSKASRPLRRPTKLTPSPALTPPRTDRPPAAAAACTDLAATPPWYSSVPRHSEGTRLCRARAKPRRKGTPFKLRPRCPAGRRVRPPLLATGGLGTQPPSSPSPPLPPGGPQRDPTARHASAPRENLSRVARRRHPSASARRDEGGPAWLWSHGAAALHPPGGRCAEPGGASPLDTQAAGDVDPPGGAAP